jgi:outer membrane protein TolC
LPDIAGFYQYQKEFNTNAFTFNPPHMLGVTMNIPIFSSGQRIARISQAKIDLDKTRNTKDQLSNSLKLDFYNSRSALLTARDNFKTKSVNLQLSKKIYERALIKYTNGMISSIDLNQVQNQYLTAQSDYYSSLQELISTKNKLEQLLTKI